jgi:hypothetical protein
MTTEYVNWFLGPLISKIPPNLPLAKGGMFIGLLKEGEKAFHIITEMD